jgi:hypothetical protein
MGKKDYGGKSRGSNISYVREAAFCGVVIAHQAKL